MKPGHRGEKIAVACPEELPVVHGTRKVASMTWCGQSVEFLLEVKGKVTCLLCLGLER